MDSDFLQTSFWVQVWDAEHENDLHFDFKGHLKGHIQGQWKGPDIVPKQHAYKIGLKR